MSFCALAENTHLCFQFEEVMEQAENLNLPYYQQQLSLHQSNLGLQVDLLKIDSVYHTDQYERRIQISPFNIDKERSDIANQILSHSYDKLENIGRYQLAIILMHYDNADNFRAALKIAKEIRSDSPTFPNVNWLVCAAEDRYRLKTDLPQIWGTQLDMHGSIREPYARNARSNSEKTLCFE